MKPALDPIWIDDPPEIYCFDREATDRRVLGIAATAGLEPDWQMIDAQTRQDYSVAEHLCYFRDSTGSVYEATWFARDRGQLRVVLREW